jgi:hypothetical protein
MTLTEELGTQEAAMTGRLEQGLGILLILIVLLDIFLTVLYARIGTRAECNGTVTS